MPRAALYMHSANVSVMDLRIKHSNWRYYRIRDHGERPTILRHEKVVDGQIGPNTALGQWPLKAVAHIGKGPVEALKLKT